MLLLWLWLLLVKSRTELIFDPELTFGNSRLAFHGFMTVRVNHLRQKKGKRTNRITNDLILTLVQAALDEVSTNLERVFGLEVVVVVTKEHITNFVLLSDA
jgi:hypothetical protein